MTQVIHFDMSTGESTLKDEFFQNLDKIITARTYEAYENGCRLLGTSDLVIMIDATPETASSWQQELVFTRAQLLEDPSFPPKLREKIADPARVPSLSLVPHQAQTFWAIVLWKKHVAALAVGVQPLSKGGEA